MHEIKTVHLISSGFAVVDHSPPVSSTVTKSRHSFDGERIAQRDNVDIISCAAIVVANKELVGNISIGRAIPLMRKVSLLGNALVDGEQQFTGKTVLLGFDDMNIFKGINLKLLAMEHMLKQHPTWQGRVVLVQIANPSRGKGINLDEINREIGESCQRIDKELGRPGYEPIVFIYQSLSISERMAYYSIAECAVVTAVRDGMNLTPYEYIVCKEGVSGAKPGSDLSGPKKNMLVVSEFIGCSPSLSGAIRVNPWNVESTAEAMYEAISLAEREKELQHEKHYRYVSSRDVAFSARSFLQDMERTCVDDFRKRCWGIGLGFGFRVVALDPNFRKLSMDEITSAYCRAKRRAILLDYDGTLMSQNSIIKTPSAQVLSLINTRPGDPKNLVFMVSGKGRDSLSKWFLPCKTLGLSAEHGYFLRTCYELIY
ncbi:hypothetical protein SASPL_129317 [Salvia splendens]|uniref:Trehalose 6-phosphate synthase/phosphatase n=1 Tax=Salvia splendens TaxID=180675 RepID=A0A8X8ZPB8_SALSN|nr:hypothetical protein SASPL_129317 [Salvia splendens]